VRVPLSYPSEQQPLAERINHVLQSEGHRVFYDRDDLPAGQTYGDLIRHGIQRCHLDIPLSAKYIYVQLRYIDGSDPERKKIPIVEEDIDRGRLGGDARVSRTYRNSRPYDAHDAPDVPGVISRDIALDRASASHVPPLPAQSSCS
jgi:hypothetical protein